MSKKKKNKQTSYKKEKTKTRAYELHSDAVEKLASADEGKEKYSDKEIKQYKKGGLDAIPVWFKANFIKFWFYCAICFFFFMGVGYYLKAILDKLLVLAIATGIVNDILVANILRFFDDGSGNYTKWMLFSKKSYASFIFNLLYGFVLVFIVYLIYYGINKLVGGALVVEPFLFGGLYLILDTLFIGIKRLILKIVADANKKLEKENKEENEK